MSETCKHKNNNSLETAILLVTSKAGRLLMLLIDSYLNVGGKSHDFSGVSGHWLAYEVRKAKTHLIKIY